MSRAINIGVWAGVFGVFIIVLFGGQSVLAAGLICGLLAGLLAGARTEGETMQAGVRDGLISGAVAGVILIVSNILRNTFITTLVGQNLPSTGEVLSFGIAGAAISMVLGAALGAAHFLPGRRSSYATWAILGLVILIYPFLDYSIQLGWLGIVITGLIFILLALGLNIVVGYAGLLDLGYAAFFAIGAYTAAFLSSSYIGDQLNFANPRVSFWLVIFIAAAMAGLFGLILGAPTLPLRGDYLAIVTLGFGEIVPIVFRNLDTFGITIFGHEFIKTFNLTGGELGISPIDPPKLPGLNFADRSDQRPWYFLLVLIILFSIFLINRLRGSRLGRAWMAMREDELAASSMGINIVRTKLLAFAMGASFSGFGGAYFGAFVGGAFPSSFDFSVSVIVLCMVILGGLGNIPGVIVGGLIIELSDRLFLPQITLLLQSIAQHNANNPSLSGLQRFDPTLYRTGLFGLVLVLMMQLRPEGLLPNARRKLELHADQASPGEAAQSQTDLYDVETEAASS
ncbi:MAG: branched-chain amino acid ABC transporter permease [Herpetosiphonaceae bacterium]|nr:branched-chain amino acid ABC transporter permease [Herpetosiphonaceae bacterium]